METPSKTFTDSDRLDAIIKHGWRISFRKGKARIAGVTDWMNSPRDALDKALANLPHPPTHTEKESNWPRWEIRVFPAEMKKEDIVLLARQEGRNVSVRRIRKTGDWHAMAL
jgi:hypothetical protein